VFGNFRTGKEEISATEEPICLGCIRFRSIGSVPCVPLSSISMIQRSCFSLTANPAVCNKSVFGTVLVQPDGVKFLDTVWHQQGHGTLTAFRGTSGVEPSPPAGQAWPYSGFFHFSVDD
jgi:hypothetical protein